MALETEEFLAKFHNLPQNAIGERKKSLNLLLRNIPRDHDAIITALIPKNHLEELFKLELLLKLQRIPELVEILKSGDEHLIKKLLQNKCFCQKLSSILEENCDGFITNVFPCMSYVSKRRLLKKLAIYGHNLDSLFDEITNHYGLHLAIDVLLGCTQAKIRSVVEECKIDFQRSQRKLLHKKFNISQRCFIKGQKKRDRFHVEAEGSTAAYDIMDMYPSYYKWGKRLTRKLLLNSKEFIIANARTFYYSLHPKTLVKTLNEEDFKRFYFKCWPTSIEVFNGTIGIRDKLEKQLGKRHYPLLLEGVKEVYNKSLYDYPDLISYEMLETMEETEREKWITIKKEDSNVIAYLKTSESIPVLKKKLKKTEKSWDRDRMIRLLVETCKINQDLNALAKVAKYVSIRYRNDDRILKEFLSDLKRYFELKKLEHRHWKLILPLLKLIRSKEDFSYMVHEFDLAHFEFLFTQKKLKEENLLKFIKTIKSVDRWHSLDGLCDELKKVILLKLIDIMPELMEKDDELHCYDLRIIGFIIEWNKKHPHDQILLLEHPRLVDSISKSFKDMTKIFDRFVVPKLFLNYESTMKLLIYKNEKSDLRDEALKIYFSVGHQFYDLKIDLWLLKFQPEIIAANFYKFMEHVTYFNRFHLNKFIYWIQKYSHLDFPRKAVDFCLMKLRLSNENKGKKKLFKIVAILSSCEKFLQYVSPYYPFDDEMDVDEEEEDKDDEKNKAAIDVVNSLKYTTSAEVLPTLMEYSRECLNCSLESLYYLFYHLPENKLSAFLNDLSTQAVSVIKNTIFLTCIVGNISCVKTLITRFIEKEHNVWVRKQVFSAAFKYFVKNPSDDLWETVKLWLTKLENSGYERFEVSLNLLKEMPLKYQSYHVLFVWECWKKTDEYKSSSPALLLHSISPEAIKDLPLQLILELIAENFLKNRYRVDEFIVSCLIKTDFKNEILNAMFDVVSEIRMPKDEDGENLQEQKRVLGVLSNFVGSCVKKIAIKERNEEILDLFSQKWYELSRDEESEVSEERLLFTLGRFYCKFGGEDLLQLNKAIMDFLKELTMTYGTGIVDFFADVLKTTFNFYNERDNAYFDLCMDIMARNELIYDLLVIRLLPDNLPSAKEDLEEFHRIIQMLRLRGSSAKLVLVYLNRYIRSVSFLKNCESPMFF